MTSSGRCPSIASCSSCGNSHRKEPRIIRQPTGDTVPPARLSPAVFFGVRSPNGPRPGASRGQINNSAAAGQRRPTELPMESKTGR